MRTENKNKPGTAVARILVLMILGVLLTSCATAPKGGTTMDRIDESLAEGTKEPKAPPAAAAQPPAVVSEALLPPINIDVPGSDTASIEPRFDVSVSNAPAREFFMGLIEGTPYNMVVHPQLSGEISLNLKNVNIPEVMEVVRDVYGYEYSRKGSMYQVMPIRLQTRMFNVNYLNVTRSGQSQTRVSSGQVTQPEFSISGTAATTQTTSGEDQISGSKVKTESSADFWTEFKAALGTIVGREGGRNVIVSPQTGVVVVRAMPAELRDVELFLKRVQTSIQRQVILEAKILEVELKDGFQSGINWTVLGEPGAGKTVIGGQLGGGTIFSGEGVAGSSGDTVTLNPDGSTNPFDAIVTTAFGGVFALGLNLNNFTAFIELLETQGNVQVLSSPRVSTVNNQKAVIKVGTDEFFVTNISTTNTTSTTATTTNPNVTLTPFFSGIALDVIPQIDEDGAIILHIHPSVSEVTEETKIIGLSQTDSISVPLAVSTIRESDSIVRARNGQIIVIGGLMQNNMREETASVPLLGDIPYLGALFRHTRQSSVKSELVILLRPIVVGERSWREVLRRSTDTYKSLNRGFHYGGKQEVFGSEAERTRR